MSGSAPTMQRRPRSRAAPRTRQTALARGRLQLGGNIEVLTRHADALAALDDATAELRARTTYGDTTNGDGDDESP